MDGKNVPFHREHRSKRGRTKGRVGGMRQNTYRNSKDGKKWKRKNTPGAEGAYDGIIFI